MKDFMAKTTEHREGQVGGRHQLWVRGEHGGDLAWHI